MAKKSEITKSIIKGILITGGIAIAATDPTFGYKVLRKIVKDYKWREQNKKTHKKFYDTFYSLKKRDMIYFENRNGQIYISLTPEGKKLAGKYQIDDLEITKPKKWDGKWRILISDIENKKKLKREALRGKIKDLGLYQIQKSVWVYPYNFQKEINLLRSFFGFSQSEIKIIVASEIEGDRDLRRHFGLS